MPLRRPFRRASTPIVLALAIALGALALNLILARQLVQIGRDARALAETWISRSATLAVFETALRDYRQLEAQQALRTASGRPDDLDALGTRADSLLTHLAALEATAGDTGTIAPIRERWASYASLERASRALPGGEASAAMRAFRAREPVFRTLVGDTRRAQAVVLKGADQIAARNTRSTRVSTGLLAASLLLTVAGIALAELARRSRTERAAAVQRWEDVADQSIGIVWELDRRGRFRFCSRAGFELLGEPSERVIGRHALRFLVAGDRRLALAASVRNGAIAQQVRDLEVRVLRADGSPRWIAVSGQRLSDSSGAFAGFRGLAVDITRRAQAEEALSQRRRLEAVGTLAGGVAHDLNNVLTSVNGYAQLMQTELPKTHRSQDDLAAIVEAAGRGASLVRRVLQFARHNPAPHEPVELAEVVHEVVRLLRPQRPPHVKVTVTLPDTACHVMADATELHQVVLNIAVNALRAMQRTGSRMSITLATDARDVVLTVTDDGEGMRPEVLERALEPFFTTRAVGEGTGMGLSMAHGVVTSCGGSLTLSSEVAVGTTVRVRLPRLLAERPARHPAPDDETQPASLRVLLVDDDPQVRNSVSRLLEQWGNRVESFATARSALEALDRDPQRADVILTDLTMPIMNGLEFAAAVTRLPSPPPIVMSSGYLDAASSAEAQRIGIVRLLEKPVQSPALRQALQAAVNDRRTPRDCPDA